MVVYVVISGYHYEAAESIEGIYLNKESAEEKLSTLENDYVYYCYVEECEVIE